MAPHEVVDLISSSDSDDEHKLSTGKAMLPTFEPRKQKATSYVRQSRLANSGASVHAKRTSKEASLMKHLTQDVQKSDTHSENNTMSSKALGLMDSEAIRRDRLEKARRFQEQRRLSDDTRAKLSTNGHPKQLHKHEPSGDTSVTLPANTSRSLLPTTVAEVPVLSGSGLVIRRSMERPTESSPARDDLKRRVPIADLQEPDPNSFKKARTGGHHSQAVLVDLSESSAQERISYLDEFRPPHIDAISKLKDKATPLSSQCRAIPHTSPRPERQGFSGGPNRNGLPYSPEEDALLKKLKDEDGLRWDQIVHWFNGRTRGSLQVRYSTKLSSRTLLSSSSATAIKHGNRRFLPVTSSEQVSDGVVVSRPKRNRIGTTSAREGFVSWASLKGPTKQERLVPSRSVSDDVKSDCTSLLNQDRIETKSVCQILHQRELGSTNRRAWSSTRTVTEELRNHAFSNYGLRNQYHGTSGDVVALSWSNNGRHFAAGSIAITDNRSMQYNMQRNLLLGDIERGEIHELVEHHVPRPKIDDDNNVNGLHAMVASQDSRLFMTISATEFAPLGNRFYTAGTDRMLRGYTIGKDELRRPKCRYTIEHAASVDLLAVKAGHNGIVATGCHSASDSITILRCRKKEYEQRAIFSPRRRNLQTQVDIFPSALKWGLAPHHQNLLLAGFSGEEEKQQAGEVCLWDGQTGNLIELHAATRNVFDVAWNPLPSSASIAFAVAVDPSGIKISRGMRTAVHCFAPNENQGRRVMTWECPAVDINDLAFCPHDQNLIAAGATDGNVYVWDIRSASRSEQPLHVLQHGETENVLAYDQETELVDTGVRFLSWGATKSRLFSGSSDGVVKVWNPYRSYEGTHVEDLEAPMQRRSAVLSGAFSPDYQDLLVGTENGQISQFHVGSKGVYKVQPFKLRPAAPPLVEEDEPFVTARTMIDTGQVELRPFGAMPLRQAVQGPNYQGPFLAPTANDFAQTEQTLQQALCLQNEAVSKRAAECPEEEDGDGVTNANAKVREAQRACEDLEERLKHFQVAETKARELQNSLEAAEKERELLQLRCPAEPCKLDCAVLATDDSEPEDSGRSVLRIPGALRSISRDALPEAGDEPDRTCTSCFPMNSRKGRRLLCGSCRLKKAGLTAICGHCAGPMRAGTDRTKKPLCERCSFSCFRCSRILKAQPGLTSVSCSSCNLEWEAGVLGYELVSQDDSRSTSTRRLRGQDDDDDDELGAQEMEHYASMWEAGQNKMTH